MEQKEAGYIDYLLGGKELLNEAEKPEYSKNEFRIFVDHPEKPLPRGVHVAAHTDEQGYIRVNPYPGNEIEIAVWNKHKNEYARLIVPKELFPEFKKFVKEQLDKV